MRRLLLLAAVGVLAVGCAEGLGRDLPECDRDVPNSIVIEAQSVPGTRYVPCIDALPAGWQYVDVEAVNGASTFWLNSDLMGHPFLTVLLEESCDVGDAVPTGGTGGSVQAFREVVADVSVPIAVVPEGGARNIRFRAEEIVDDLDGRAIGGRIVTATVDRGEGPTVERIELARSSGAHVLIVGTRDFEEGTVTLLLAGAEELQPDVEIEAAVEQIEDDITPPRYRGSWYQRFEGGCITYEFDASGVDVLTIEDDVETALDLYDIDPLRESARNAGYEVP